jgi:hypothetical protein
LNCDFISQNKICGKSAIGVCPSCHRAVCTEHSHMEGAELYCNDHSPQTIGASLIGETVPAKEIPFTPIFGTKNGIGLYQTDINRLKAKEGDWVEVRNKEKKISTQLRQVDRHPELKWADNIAWIRQKDATDLGLKNISISPAEPNKEFLVNIHKHSFPRSKVLYLAILTFIFGSIATVLSGLVQADLVGQNKFVLGVIAVLFTLVAMALSGITALVQKQ